MFQGLVKAALPTVAAAAFMALTATSSPAFTLSSPSLESSVAGDNIEHGAGKTRCADRAGRTIRGESEENISPARISIRRARSNLMAASKVPPYLFRGRAARTATIAAG